VASSSLLLDARAGSPLWIDRSIIDHGHLANIGPSAFAVYCVFIHCAQTMGTIPTTSTLAVATGMDQGSVLHGVKRLREYGLLHIGDDKTQVKRCEIRDLPSKHDDPHHGKVGIGAGGVNPNRLPKPSRVVAEGYPSDFERVWEAYPKRPNNSKKEAYRAWLARMNEGVDPETMMKGVEAYARYVEGVGTEPTYIKMASTFFGPGEHYSSDYTVPEGGTGNGDLLKFYDNDEVV
jgi:hypothetical protein